MIVRFCLKRIVTVALWLVLAERLIADPVGPTLHFDYGHGQSKGNAVDKFMYFVPLVSPVTVTVVTNLGNTQSARVSSYTKKISGSSFTVNCAFDFTGAGSQQSVFDDANTLDKHAAELKAGNTLKHQLGSINVEGSGIGSAEIQGILTNGQFQVNELRMHFNRDGHLSPVTIDLYDLRLKDEKPVRDNYMVARVNQLEFKRTTGTPKMEVTLASIKRKNAPNNGWQKFIGSIKGAAANAFLPPLTVQPEGQQTMMDFGRALAEEKPEFTFPLATRLKATEAAPQAR